MLSERQELILHSLIKEYIDSAEPISSDLLKKRSHLTVSPATIRNELQELTELGYIMQPHTSAGRVPTEKGYKFFAIWISHTHEDTAEDLVLRQIQHARAQMEKEMEVMEKFIQTLAQDDFFEILKILDLWNKRTEN
jgi:heat-inducible transcriptional repressor